MNILGHTSHVGTTGYNAHSQGFFRVLSNFHNVKLRNFTVGKDWQGISAPNPHGNDVSEKDKQLIVRQTLFNDGKREDFSIYSGEYNNPDINIVLNNVDHHYFYDSYVGKKVAYVVWENSLYPDHFFNKLKEYDQVWVASSWQKRITIDQGIPEHKVKVVPEGVDSSIYHPNGVFYTDKPFRFLIFGAWGSRKSTKELIQCFIECFGNNPNVELVLSVENRFANDGLSSTEERLKKYNLISPNIKVVSFLDHKDYVKYLQEGHVFLSCARGEGWNIPLLEAMSCGTPSIYSDCSGQTEFTKGRGIPISANILISANSFEDKNAVGFWYEPDFQELKSKMMEVYNNYHFYKKQALEESEQIRREFTWENAALIANNFLKELNSPNVLTSCSFIGDGGFNSLAQNLLPELNNHVNIRVRNFTVYPDWAGYSFEPHGQHIKEKDKQLMLCQTLIDDNVRHDLPIYNKTPFSPDLYLIINEAEHLYFYDQYSGPKIGYTMNETTRFSSGFLERMKEYDQFWVPSSWQKDCLIEQNFPSEKIRVVPLGVDSSLFNTNDKKLFPKFTFGLFGRWDQRKNTKEIIRCFKELFGNNPNVELILSVDNPYNVDGFGSTENRLKAYNLESPNIKIVHFPDQKEYIHYLKSIHVFLSCSKGEGWNLPLIEAMACGTPAIYSNCSGQLEFAADLGVPVNILKTDWAKNHVGIGQFDSSGDGEYYIPDFEDLKTKMSALINNYRPFAAKAFIESSLIRIKYPWQKSAKLAATYINEVLDKRVEFACFTKNKLGIEYKNVGRAAFTVNISISDSSKELYRDSLSLSPGIQYFSALSDKVQYSGDLIFRISDSSGKILLEKKSESPAITISNESPSLGDGIAWMGVVDQFQRLKNKKIKYYTPFVPLFRSQYPQIDVLDYSQKPSKTDYSLGCFDPSPQKKWQECSLQELACEQLGIPFIESRPKISLPSILKNNFSQKYVCIATQSTAQAKYWNNPNGWNQTVLYLKSLGYAVVCIDKYYSYGNSVKMNTMPEGCIDKTGDLPFSDRINDLYFCDFFIGLGSGLSWLAWALNKPTVLISGFSKPLAEFSTPYRVHNPNVCNGCFNNRNIKFDPSNWMWCPEKKDFECSRQISFEMVKEKIDQLIKDSNKNS